MARQVALTYTASIIVALAAQQADRPAFSVFDNATWLQKAFRTASTIETYRTRSVNMNLTLS